MPRPTNDELTEKAQLSEQGLKRCRSCREVLPFDSFGAYYRGTDGLQVSCKKCVNTKNIEYDRASRIKDPELYRERKKAEHKRYKDRHPDKHVENVRKANLRKYGLTLETFYDMRAQQGGRCASCGDELGTGRDVHIDHDHVTGAVRGLLCGGCNTGIGHFKERPEALRAAAEYLERYKVL